MLSSDGILSTTPPEILVSCPRKRKLLAAKCGALDHGFFLILLSLGVAVFDSSNSLAIGLAFFILLYRHHAFFDWPFRRPRNGEETCSSPRLFNLHAGDKDKPW